MWGKLPNLSAPLPLITAALEDACRAVALAPAYRKAWSRTQWVAIDITPALEPPHAALLASRMAKVCARALALEAGQCRRLSLQLTQQKHELLQSIRSCEAKGDVATVAQVREHVAVQSTEAGPARTDVTSPTPSLTSPHPHRPTTPGSVRRH